MKRIRSKSSIQYRKFQFFGQPSSENVSPLVWVFWSKIGSFPLISRSLTQPWLLKVTWPSSVTPFDPGLTSFVFFARLTVNRNPLKFSSWPISTKILSLILRLMKSLKFIFRNLILTSYFERLCHAFFVVHDQICDFWSNSQRQQKFLRLHLQNQLSI